MSKYIKELCNPLKVQETLQKVKNEVIIAKNQLLQFALGVSSGFKNTVKKICGIFDSLEGYFTHYYAHLYRPFVFANIRIYK